jgi:hypothetical protein
MKAVFYALKVLQKKHAPHFDEARAVLSFQGHYRLFQKNIHSRRQGEIPGTESISAQAVDPG